MRRGIAKNWSSFPTESATNKVVAASSGGSAVPLGPVALRERGCPRRALGE